MNEIYKSTNWGNVCSALTGWGNIYKSIANCNTPIVDAYEIRVIADGGSIESLNCIK